MFQNLKGISKNPYYLFGLTFNSSPLERKRSVFRDDLNIIADKSGVILNTPFFVET